jgi:FKBP-type peptidyl-prolyl cis-trans isomerase SlyD
VFEIPRDRLPANDMNIGDRFRMGNGQQAMVVTVTKLTDSHVTMDANHPLAGQRPDFLTWN